MSDAPRTRATSTPTIPVVIPAYNEATTIRDVVERTLVQAETVIVVDDGSTDGTSSQLRDLPIVLIVNERNEGKAASIWRGAEEALRRGAGGIVTIDGDGQHDPEDLPRMFRAAALRPSAIIVGARLHARKAIPLERYLANRLANFWIAWAAGRPIEDSQSGFRYYPAAVFEALDVRHDRASSFVFESEVLIAAARSGIELAFVPVSVRYGNAARPSHLHPVFDIGRIAAMLARRLIGTRFDPRGVLGARRWRPWRDASHDTIARHSRKP